MEVAEDFFGKLLAANLPGNRRTKISEVFRHSPFPFSENQKNPRVRKFLSAILGPEMGASILWTPGKMHPFCRKKTHVHKIPRFRGGVNFGFWGGGGGASADFIFMGARIFLKKASCP